MRSTSPGYCSFLRPRRIHALDNKGQAHPAIMVNSALPPLPIPKVRARQINEGDIDGVVDLLPRGFRLRSRDYWQRALAQLAARQTPAELPKFGYLLQSGGDLVGVILLIFSTIPGAGAPPG